MYIYSFKVKIPGFFGMRFRRSKSEVIFLPLRTITNHNSPDFTISNFEQIIMFYQADLKVQTALWEDPYRRHEIWRYVTVMFVHNS